MMITNRKRLSFLFAILITVTCSVFGAEETVDTKEMTLVFDAGWLVKWVNKVSGESIDFGKPSPVADGQPGWVYRPGAWWHPSDRPAVGQQQRATWETSFVSSGPQEVTLTQSLKDPVGKAEAVQWSVQVPLDKAEFVNIPWGMRPSAMASANSVGETLLHKSYYFENRNAALSFHEWRQRFYLIQGKTGGLIIYVDDPNFEHRQALEWDLSKKSWMTLANRSMACSPIKDSYTSGKWIIRQYQGWMNEGAQVYQDYLKKTYDIVPIENRNTKWIKKLAFCITKPAFFNPPKGSDGQLDYIHFKKNLDDAQKQIDDLAKVVNPDQVMLYLTAWRQAPHDCNFPDINVDPFFSYTSRMARKKGFHVMLHMHDHLLHDETLLYRRYVRNMSKQMGVPVSKDPADDVPYGVGYDPLRDIPVIQRRKDFNNASFYKNLSVNTTMTGYHMHPGWEAWRYMKVASIVDAVQATGADMIHLDVPAKWHDKNDDRYPFNIAQGERELYKLLRETLDDAGLKHVVIATECIPPEPILRYVDMAQVARGYDVRDLVSRGYYAASMVELQTDKNLDEIMAARKKSDKDIQPFDPERLTPVITRMENLGMPNLLSLANSSFVLGYPHLGAISPVEPIKAGKKELGENAMQAMQIWWTILQNTVPNTLGSILPSQPVSDGRVCLEQFWEKNAPEWVAPKDWKKGDIARYRLKDGSALWVTRLDPLTMRFHLDKGKILADLNVYEGWRNDAILREYWPKELDDLRKKNPNPRIN